MRLPDSIAARAAAFSIVGIVNGVAGIAVIVAAALLGAGVVLANALGYGTGLVISFTLNSKLTFGSRKADRYTVLRFLVAFAVSFGINIAAVVLARHWLGLHKLLASLAGTPLYVIAFYLQCEYWVFRPGSHEA